MLLHHGAWKKFPRYLNARKQWDRRLYQFSTTLIPQMCGNKGGLLQKHWLNMLRTDKVEMWRAALKEVADLSGFHLRGQPNDRYPFVTFAIYALQDTYKLESQVVEEIAQDISEKLMCNSFVDIKPLVGIDSRAKQIELLLCFDSNDVRIVGIWGMGGIGKTTTAEAVYKRFVAKFDGCCFVNVRKELDYQRKLFSKILGDENLNVDTSSLDASIVDRLQRKKVFFVLDDVNHSVELDLLSLKFGPGSRAIVISRDKQLLDPVVDVTYEVRGLIDDEALQLFSLCAFKQNHPKEDFVGLSKEVVHYVQGVPLALRVYGSSLYGKTLELWKGDLKKLKEIPKPEIDNILKISFDGLDGEVKEIFLDIACFFNWKQRDYVEDVLDGYYISAISGVRVLIDRSLLTISNDQIKMHDLLRQMAFNIIRQESKEPGKRSRLWTPEDICPVLEHNTGTQSVQGMLLDMSTIRRKVCIRPTAFASMYKLKFLKVQCSESKVFLKNGLESLPDSLSYFHWDKYPSNSLSSNFCPENLVELSLRNSHVEQLWDGVQNLVKLKRLDLSFSSFLLKIPDLSKAINLERIELHFCTNLKEVHPSIRYLNKLSSLNLESCEKLENFPSIVPLRSVKALILIGCSNVTKFPEIPENLENLYLRKTAIEEVPSSIGGLGNLKYLDLRKCKRLERLSDNICKLKSLEKLDLNGCLKLESFPEISEAMQCLKYLDLRNTSIEEIHSSIKNLVGLIKLKLDYCKKLKKLPSSIRELKSLEKLSLMNCSNVTKFPEIQGNLVKLNLSGTSIEQLPSSINCLSKLEELYLNNCPNLGNLPRNIFKLESLDQNRINWVKTPLGFQQRATEDVKLYQKVPNIESSVFICFPGSESEIPKWFSRKSQGSSVTIQLPPYLHDDKFVGFIVCAVLAFSDNLNTFSAFGGHFDVSCVYNFNTNDDHVCDFPFSKGPRSVDSNHVFFGYDINMYYKWYNYKESSKHHLNEASFEFFVCNMFGEHLPDFCVVKECGVCLLYAKDDLTVFPHRPSEESSPLMIQPSSPHDPTSVSLKCGVTNQDFVEPMVEDGTIINQESGSSDLYAQPSSSDDPTWLSLNCGVINPYW